MRKLVPLLALAAVAYAAPFGCSKPAPSTVSNVAGTLALESFPSAVHQITVVDKNGQKTRVAVGKDGSFSVPLAAGSSYRLFLSDDGSALPMVLSSRGGKLAGTIRVVSGGAKVDLGKVQYWAGLSAGGGAVLPALPAASGACDGEENDDGDDGENQDGAGDGQTDESGADCVDGIDAVTHQECDGGPAANQNDGEAEAGDEVDESAPMGVPENGISGDVGCGGDDQGDGDGENED